MPVVRVELGPRSYNIYIGLNLLTQLPKLLVEAGVGQEILLVTNPTVDSYYGPEVRSSLIASGLRIAMAVIPDGENYKSLHTVAEVYDRAVEAEFGRRAAVVALGGGVVGDTAGFVAATYMRGVPFVQVPTTLLAQVDSSVGGKVAVNHSQGKNLIGSFYQPRFVLADLKTLQTLPGRELRGGLAEVIKYGVIRDEQFFSYLENHLEDILALEPGPLEEIITASCQIKAEVVATDEREEGLRAILNYGHTVGHAIETLTGYTTYLHGEALAIGMVAAAKIAARADLLGNGDVERLEKLLLRAGLPVKIPDYLVPDEIVQVMRLDKKRKDGRITLILPRRIGEVIETREIGEKEIISALLRG